VTTTDPAHDVLVRVWSDENGQLRYPFDVLQALRSEGWDLRPVPQRVYQITVCSDPIHIKCEHAIKCSRCNGDGEVAVNAARTVPPVICPSCGGTGFKRHTDTDRLTVLVSSVIADMEEDRLCNTCPTDECTEHDEMPEVNIGCTDSHEIAARLIAAGVTVNSQCECNWDDHE
jgi:hypothetical protein